MHTQKGLSLVEGLLIILVISVIGFGGYYVWSQQDDEETNTNETVQVEPVNNQQEEQPAEEVSTIPEGWVLFEDEELGIAFAYPSEWTIDSEVGTYLGDDKSIRVYSPDFVENDEETIGGVETKQGAFVRVVVNESELTDINELQRPSSGLLGDIWSELNPVSTTVADLNAEQWEFTYEGDEVFHTELVASGRLIDIQFDGVGFDEKESSYYDTYTQMLNTVNIL